MRAFVVALLAGAALSLLPTASAEGELRLSVAGELEPFGLTEQSVVVTVDVDCAIVSGVPPQVRVTLAIEDEPAWLKGSLEETSLAIDPASCPAARAVVPVGLKLFSYPSDAPPLAGDRATLTVRAAASDVRGTAFGASAPVEVEAGVEGRVRVAPRAGEAPSARAGEFASLTFDVVNGVNAPVTLAWAADERGPAVAIHALPFRLDTGAQGSATMHARVPPEAAPDRPLAFELVWTATREGRIDVADSGRVPVTILVEPPVASPTATGAAADDARETPLGAPAATLALALALALRRRIR